MLDNKKNNNFDFLQSKEWRNFQTTVGRKTFFVLDNNFQASIIEHRLPFVGKYFYIPRGPIIKLDSLSTGQAGPTMLGMTNLLNLAKKENVGWIRIDPKNEEALSLVKNNVKYKIRKAPHDMQPKEIFVIDIAKSAEEILAEMSQKTRYNLKLAQKKEVKIVTGKEYTKKFLGLVKATASRKRIKFHNESYYQKMLEIFPENMLQLYAAEYKNKIIAANLAAFFNGVAIYLHGATDDEYRNVMAPYLLQWQAMLDAKKNGCKSYDFGGVKTQEYSDLTPTLSLLRRGRNKGSWAGITKFKIGFSPKTKPIEFPGSYDIITNPVKYWVYRLLQGIKSCF